MTHLKRWSALAALAIASAGVLVVSGATAAPAMAATEHAVTRPYAENWVFRSTKLHRCVFIDVTGSISGQWRYAYTNGDTDDLVWSSLKLNDPTVTAEAWPITSTGCDSTHHWNMKADLTQGWYQHSCAATVSVSVGFPWSLSASPAYSCSTNRVGHRSSTEGFSTSPLHQYNSGSPIHFSSVLAKTSLGGVAFTGVITVRAHTSSSSDEVRHTTTASINR